jgi:hypothetical protein
VADWRDQILKEFTPQVARLTLVADPDGLLLEEALLQAIRERGFELIPFEDHVAFRFAYESKFRSHWDRGEITDLVVVLRAESHDLSTLPYDLLQAGRQLSFNLGELFPNLSYPVIASLDRSDLDALYGAQARHRPDRLGDNATKDFVLLHVFEIAAALIRQPPELLRVLLRRHYRGQRIPRLLDDRLVQVLRQSGAFESWPIETIVPDREAFFAFLQERWPSFLDRLATDAGAGLQEEGEPYGLEIEGPKDLPFDHDDVRVFIDNLFVEGLLRPVTHRCSNALSDKWVAAGIRIDPTADRLRRLHGLIETVRATIPTPEARHRDWSVFAYRWSELSVLWSDVTSIAPPETRQRVGDLRSDVDQAFTAWIGRRYAGLYNQPPDPPAMVHHLPRYLARQLSDTADRKVALVVVDGIALDQWIVLRDVLADQRPRFRLREGAVFAWVPTITSVSRQATFAGKPPLYFPSSIHTTDKEPSLWTQFWVDQGLTMHEVGYARGLGDGSLDGVRELASRPRLRALGLVVDKVDKIMHGMELGTAGMHNQVNQWANQQFVANLLDVLFDQGFIVFLTSDHGNIEAEGCGRPSEGAVADLRGERARVYSDQILRAHVKQRFPHAIEWPAIGLPEEYWVLLAQGRSAFVREGERIVGHGGISLEEIVVPMVQIERLPE